ncbi:MAG TPA: hypothetical protein VHG30_17075 [Microvirga sp.]|nr:hypothetical protein [Microvirga sp.]
MIERTAGVQNVAGAVTQPGVGGARMDVIVSRAPGSGMVWNLTDRLGRKVGQIARLAEDQFVILAPDIAPDAPLSKVEAVQPSLDAAMDEIAKRLRGVCQLWSQEDR